MLSPTEADLDSTERDQPTFSGLLVMTPDDLARELQDLDRFAPPPAALDPAHLLALETRASDLAHENAELRLSVSRLESQLAELQSNVGHKDSELLALRSSHLVREKDWELERADWRRQQQYWSPLALSERAHLRSQYSRWIYSASLAIAGLALCAGFWIAANHYWTFTHDQQLQMMQTAAQDKAAALSAYHNAQKQLADAARLRNQSRREKKSTAAPRSSTGNAGTRQSP